MVNCDNCFDPDCARSVNPGVPCNCVDINVFQKLPDGSYGTDLTGKLPASATSITTGLIDAITKYTAPAGVVVPLTAPAIALYNGGVDVGGAPWLDQVTGANGDHLFQLVCLFKHTALERADILNHLDNLTLTAATGAQKTDCRSASNLCTAFLDRAAKLDKEIAKSPDSFEDAKFPLARLYLIITKACAVSLTTLAKGGLTSGRFDPLTGQVQKSFEKLPAIESMNMFHCIKEDFQKAVLALGKNGGKVAWDPFWQIIRELGANRNDHALLHELVFETLSSIDRKQSNITTFMLTQWTTHFTCFMTKWGENEAASGSDPTPRLIDNIKTEEGITGDDKLKLSTHVKFGPVTKQGECSGEMRTRNGFIAYCNKWNQSQPCTSGVFTGRNKGKCSYTHRCRYCGKPEHKGEEKHPAGHAQAGTFVCPKHG